MKKIFATCGVFLACVYAVGALAVGVDTTGGDTSRSGVSLVTNANSNNAKLRGNQAIASAYKNNQINTYFMLTQVDVDTACREKIYKCLSDYCGDVTLVPGRTTSKCTYATESELYNYALLCLQKDTTALMPQYNVNAKGGARGMNTAARLCPQYVQQELMSYLSMSNMAEQLSKSHSDLCVKRRKELEAAMACHSVALLYGDSTNSKLVSELTETCGNGVAGGSNEMVRRFANAGNIGANIWEWADKISGLSLNNKSQNWQVEVDAVLNDYANRMNLACGDNLQLNLTSSYNTSNGTIGNDLLSASKTVAFPTGANPNEYWPIFMEITSRIDVYDADTANQVVNAGLTNSPLTQNSYFTSAQMDDMQSGYKKGTKVYILRDGSRCYIVPVQTLSSSETSMIAQTFSSCVSR
ncbi:MAG: hypothetical protein ACLRFI_03615 [Alphaproteobacteria bacterium]